MQKFKLTHFLEDKFAKIAVQPKTLKNNNFS